MDSEVIELESLEAESLQDIGTGRNELVLRCITGPDRDFFYCSMTSNGEVFGSVARDRVTVLIESPRISPEHASIIYNPSEFIYILRDLGSESGTWVKVQTSYFGEQIIYPNMTISIGDQIFTAKIAGTLRLEDVWKNLVQPNYVNYSSLEEFLRSDVSENRGLRNEVRKLQSLPREIQSYDFISDSVQFNVGYCSILIGNTPNCHIKSPVSCKIAFNGEKHVFINEDSNRHRVFRKLESDEEFHLDSGNIIKIGGLLFEAVKFNVGIQTLIGLKDTMEDRHAITHNIQIFSELAVPFYAVYDGHGGSECAKFIKKRLHNSIEREFKNRPNFNIFSELKRSIEQAFYFLDADFRREFPDISNETGSCAICCMIVGDRIITSNLGDCRAVLCRKGRAIDLSRDHKADNEVERIHFAGGSVISGRINGKLAVGRAFGDFALKPMVSIQPEITQIFLNPIEDEFLVLACDGIYDFYSSQEVVDTIRHKILLMDPLKQDPFAALRSFLNDIVINKKNADNITTILVMLKSSITSSN